MLGQVVAHQLGAFAVIRAYKRNIEVFAFEYFRVQAIVDVDHLDTGIGSLFQHTGECLGVGGSNDKRINLGVDHFVDNGDLRAGIGFVLDAVGDQLEFCWVRFLVILRTVGHGDEKLIGKGLHDQTHGRRFGSVIGKCRRERQSGGCGSKHSNSKKTSSKWQLHGFTPIL